MKDFIKVSIHINNLLGCFDRYFKHASFSEAESRQILNHSNQLHRRLVEESNLTAYDRHLELARSVYRIMLLKINHQQIIEDILFCGSSELSWEETSRSLSDLYRIDLHSKEIYTFYYLHEINNGSFIDSPLPTCETINDQVLQPEISMKKFRKSELGEIE